MQKTKNSLIIKPLIILIDFCVINISVFFLASSQYKSIEFILYLTFVWLLISLFTKFYNVYRYTHITQLLKNIVAHFFLFTLGFFAYFSIFKEGQVIDRQFIILTTILLTTTFLKIFIFYFLKNFRTKGGNTRNVVIFGNSKSTQNVAKLFSDKHDLGYQLLGFFSDKQSRLNKYLGTIEKGLEFIAKSSIDEVYCDVNSITTTQLQKIRKYGSENDVEINLIPENKAIYSKDFELEYFGVIPILKSKKLPFEKFETHLIKRFFDVLFSLIIIIFILPWLLPILLILIKLDSKGPLFFKQKRDGLNGKQFYCYKLRTMKVNTNADIVSASIDDERITKIGKFLRKSSLDELPQFFNVLKGDMSVVGPRPHINIQTKKYTSVVKNYLFRHSIRPGITGLAQISGYRGEVKNNTDIENRVRLDIFYIENWSFALDIKIIFQTCINFFKGQEKAY